MLAGLVVVIVVVLSGTPQPAAFPAVSAPARVADLDASKLKGEAYRLAWSPEGRELYLQTVERDKAGLVKTAHHYLVAAGGSAPRRIDAEPEWAAAYWTWKSAQAAPDRPGFRITVEDRQQRLTATATPMGGDLARGSPEGTAGTGMSDPGALAAAVQSQMAHVYTLRLKGEVVGEFLNAVAVPGLTFGWSPARVGVIAFTNREGRLLLMDEQGRKTQVEGPKSALLPAWTDDGRRLAFIERTGRNTAILEILEIRQDVP